VAGILYLIFGGRQAIQEGRTTAQHEEELDREAAQLVSRVTTD